MNDEIETLRAEVELLDIECTKISQALTSNPLTYENRKWWASAKAALKVKKQQRLRLTTRIGEIKEDLKKSASEKRKTNYERAFVEASKEALTREQYLHIANLAHRLMEISQ